MTRLTEDWIHSIESGNALHEKELLRMTGMDYLGLAAAANDISRETVQGLAAKLKVAAVPVTQGEGIIGTFGDSVASIVRQAGFEAFATERTDVDGIWEAHEKGASAVFMADDDRYLAIRLDIGCISDNNKATARGYIAALQGLHGRSLTGENVLVLGCGIVGREMALRLLEIGAVPALWDKNRSLLESCGVDLQVRTLKSQEEFVEYGLILDATNEGDWLSANLLRKDVKIAAPGVPLSLDPQSLEKLADRVVHDMLEIGTLAMLGELAKN